MRMTVLRWRHDPSAPAHSPRPQRPAWRACHGQAEILDLDAEALAEHIASVTAWLPLKNEPRQIVDLGCGTGAGTFALLECFPEAHVTAVDASAGDTAYGGRASAP